MHDVTHVSQTTSHQSAHMITEHETFHRLMREKNRFIVPAIIFSLIFYFTLPILTSYTTILNTPLIGDITWAWAFAFSQFIMTWTLCVLYSRRARRFDALVEQLKNEVRS
ncbi:protein of unknown function DUF485 [Exiguobacterium sp. AT1b]|uniref:DUF485 domain-containing protein n=2 Tax=Bacillales Family XII. Incertae Sedis TaxID=539742 RepID=C4L2S0_EXISA|nr:protein of unknown function DUF485 [Exiguobacterium sp. AT1b]